MLTDGMTAFVGPNNAGKSSLFRFVYEFRHSFGQLANDPAKYLLEAMNWSGVPEVASDDSRRCSQGQGPITVAFQFSSVPQGQCDYLALVQASDQSQLLLKSLRAGGKTYSRHQLRMQNPNILSPDAGVEVTANSPPPVLLDLAHLLPVFRWLERAMYIPTMRSLHAKHQLKLYDLEVGAPVISQWARMISASTKAASDLAARAQRQLAALLNVGRVDLRRGEDDGELVVYIDSDSPRRLNDLGGGFSHMASIMLQVAARTPSLLLIDEPESGLHPSLQLRFLQSLHTLCPTGIAFTTHNMGLARSAGADIYSVNPGKSPEGMPNVHVGRFVATNAPATFLGEMSFSSYEAMGFTHVLLVEGSTDVEFFRIWLRKLKIDHRVLILSLGGKDIIKENSAGYLAELHRATKKLWAIIDSERKSEGAEIDEDNQYRTAFKNNCNTLGIECLLTRLRNTESYFSQEAVEKVFGKTATVPGPFGKAPDATYKRRAWEVAAVMDWEQFKKTDMGEFLERLRDSANAPPAVEAAEQPEN